MSEFTAAIGVLHTERLDEISPARNHPRQRLDPFDPARLERLTE